MAGRGSAWTAAWRANTHRNGPICFVQNLAAVERRHRETFAMSVRIDIVRRTGDGGSDTVEFRPTEIHVPLEERVYWCNLDPVNEHHIDLFPDDPAYTLKPYIGEPPAMTPLFSVRETTAYSCRRHPTEIGKITVP